jgi:hypothetical protein
MLKSPVRNLWGQKNSTMLRVGVGLRPGAIPGDFDGLDAPSSTQINKQKNL